LISLSLLKVLPGKASEQPSFMRRLKMIQPPPGVMLKEAYLLFGRFDGALIFEAPDAKTAMNFVESSDAGNLQDGDSGRFASRRILKFISTG